MKNLRKSIHAPEHETLRHLLTQRRQELGLTQRTLADRLDVIYSFMGKVETGDRRLDVIEFIEYCHALELSPECVILTLMATPKGDEIEVINQQTLPAPTPLSHASHRPYFAPNACVDCQKNKYGYEAGVFCF